MLLAKGAARRRLQDVARRLGCVRTMATTRSRAGVAADSTKPVSVQCGDRSVAFRPNLMGWQADGSIVAQDGTSECECECECGCECECE